MELIIDREFIDNFFLQYDETSVYQEDIRLFFRKLRKCKIITNYTSVDEFIKEAENSNPFLHLFIEESVPEIECGIRLESYLQKDEFYEKGSPVKMFFIDIKIPLIEKKGFPSIRSDNINTKWKPFYNIRNEEFNTLKTTKDKNLNRRERLEKWEDLQNFEHPIHSLIITDRYVLANERNQSLAKNLFPMLRNLLGRRASQQEVDIMIITSKINKPANLNSVYKKIDNFLRNNLKLPKYHLSIILDPPGHRLEHFRRVYTNCMRVRAENSFNVFKHNNSYFDKNNELSFNLVFTPKHRRFMIKEIGDIKTWLEGVGNYAINNPDSGRVFYYPDMKNKLLEIIAE